MGVHTFRFLPFLTKIVKMAKKNLTIHLTELEDFLKNANTTFIHGEEISISDISWSPILERLHMAGWWDSMDAQLFPCVRKYWENMRVLEAYREAVRPVEVDPALLVEIKDRNKEWKGKFPWYKALYQ